MPINPPSVPPPQLHGIAASSATAEAGAIAAFAEYLDSPDGRNAGEADLDLWLFERGWSPKKRRRWLEVIAAQQAISGHTPGAPGDPALIVHRLDARLERLAHTAEERSDIKHAIAATESQAKLHRLGGFAPSGGPTVNFNVTNATAHLVSDDELARLARTVEPISVATAEPSIDDLAS